MVQAAADYNADDYTMSALFQSLLQLHAGQPGILCSILHHIWEYIGNTVVVLITVVPCCVKSLTKIQGVAKSTSLISFDFFSHHLEFENEIFYVHCT